MVVHVCLANSLHSAILEINMTAWKWICFSFPYYEVLQGTMQSSLPAPLQFNLCIFLYVMQNPDGVLKMKKLRKLVLRSLKVYRKMRPNSVLCLSTRSAYGNELCSCLCHHFLLGFIYLYFTWNESFCYPIMFISRIFIVFVDADQFKLQIHDWWQICTPSG